MKRTQLQLDEATYQEIRRRAFDSRKSMADVIRELLHKAMKSESSIQGDDKWNRALSAVGAFHETTGPHDASIRHDDVLANTYGE